VTAERERLDTIRGEPLIYADGLYSVELNEGLQEWEVEDALRIIRMIKGNGPFLGVAGTMLVSGDPRQGKGIFGNVLAWKVKRYFKFKKVLRDDHPTALFGDYVFFNEETLIADVANMSDVAEEDIPKEAKKSKDKTKLVDSMSKWVAGQGSVIMQNSVMLKDEFWKDMNKRRPMTPMNLMFSGLLKTAYHIDLLTIGIVQTPSDLDRFTCLPWVTMHAKCVWCSSLPDTTEVTFYHVKWSPVKQKLIPIPPTDKKPIRIFLNGGLPRAELGGARYYDIFKSRSAPNLKALGSKTDFKDFRRERYGQ